MTFLKKQSIIILTDWHAVRTSHARCTLPHAHLWFKHDRFRPVGAKLRCSKDMPIKSLYDLRICRHIRKISPVAAGNFCEAEFPAPLVPCDTTPHGVGSVGTFCKAKIRTTAIAVVCGYLPPAAILRKGNARCALAKTLAQLTKSRCFGLQSRGFPLESPVIL